MTTEVRIDSYGRSHRAWKREWAATLAFYTAADGETNAVRNYTRAGHDSWIREERFALRLFAVRKARM